MNDVPNGQARAGWPAAGRAPARRDAASASPRCPLGAAVCLSACPSRPGGRVTTTVQAPGLSFPVRSSLRVPDPASVLRASGSRPRSLPVPVSFPTSFQLARLFVSLYRCSLPPPLFACHSGSGGPISTHPWTRAAGESGVSRTHQPRLSLLTAATRAPAGRRKKRREGFIHT